MKENLEISGNKLEITRERQLEVALDNFLFEREEAGYILACKKDIDKSE